MNWLVVTGLSGAIGVALGAFGAHALKTRLSLEQLGWWQTAVQYHFIHTLLLGLIAVLALRASHATLHTAGYLACFGLVFFCGSLYLMALGGPRWLGAITPLGGVAWIAAWLLLAWYGYRLSGSV